MRRMISVIARPMIGSAICAPSATSDRARDDAERDEAVDPGVLAVGGHRRAREPLAPPTAAPGPPARSRRTRSVPRRRAPRGGSGV